jgi:PKD repeat protein
MKKSFVLLLAGSFLVVCTTRTQFPVAAFSGEPTTGQVPLDVQFTDESTNDPASWAWDFGDGATSSAQNPDHTYDTAGSFNVALIVSNADGSDTLVREGYIVVTVDTSTLAANFTADPTSGDAPLAVSFTDLSTGDPTSWNWNFGDGGASTDQNPTYTYEATGSYNVSLIVSDDDGKDTLIRNDYIVVGDTVVAPTADFTASPTTGDAPLAVSFTDQSTGAPSSWDWDFGDGGASATQNPIHTYDDAGVYDVALIVSNAAGADTLVRAAYITVQGVEYKEVTRNNITLKWRTDAGNLHVILSAPTTGWVSVGFDAATAHKDANIIIGYVKNTDVYIQDNYGISMFGHASDISLGGTDDVTNPAGSEESNVTEISFTIPLDSGDPYDRPLVAGQTYTVILGYGPNGADNFTSKHAGDATVQIEI